MSLLAPDCSFSSATLSGRSASSIDLSRAPDEEPAVVLSTQSSAAQKMGSKQLIPKNLAASSHARVRHHTTVVTLPVGDSISWEDYDSDAADGFSFRGNRRNKSYRAAVTSLNLEALTTDFKAEALKLVKEEKPVSAKPTQKSAYKKTLGRIRNRKQAGSFKDDPRFYQEIRERGLNSISLSTDEEDFSVKDQSEEDQAIVVKNYRTSYMTWSQLPQVKEKGILDHIPPEERKRQEAIFEILTSEFSYKHSLSILVRHFKDSVSLRSTMTATEHHHLFSNISIILDISTRFFEDLDQRHQEDPMIRHIGELVETHVKQHFDPYVAYCSNETFQQRTFQKLASSNSSFRETLKQIEASKDCGGLPMYSFLILPMQRVTRLPLLMDTVCQKTKRDEEDEYRAAGSALSAISKLVKSCNDGARRMEQTEQMYTIQKQLEFGRIKPFPLVSSSRWLKKRGELTMNTEDLNIFRKAFSYKSSYLFLFNDVLIITRKKSDDSYVVLDYAKVENVEVEEEATTPRFSLKLLMSPNSDGRDEHMMLVAESELDRARWTTALHDLKRRNAVSGDLPQYEATKSHMPRAPDELSLQQAEVVIVLQEVDGWCHGERMRDGGRGWFPASCATQITNRNAKASNIQRMERLRKETDV